MKTKMNTSLLIGVTLMLVSTISSGVTYYVDASKPAGGNGLSWATAFNTIQAAVNAANPTYLMCFAPTDQVWVKQGTYVLTSELTIGRDPVYGGFPSSVASPTWEDRNWRAYPTIIDGNNSVRCVKITHNATLDGFIIQNGRATTGAGVYVESPLENCTHLGLGYTSPIIRNCRIRNNTATTGSGGGLLDNGSDVRIRNCEFSGNSAVASGGAIYQNNSGTEITRCIFYNNETTAPGSLGGGAFAGWGHNSTTTKYVTITNSLFYANASNSWGGAISGNQMYPTITNCTIADNEADHSGGAFYGQMYSEAPRIRNSICWGNSPDELNIVTSSTYLNVSYSNIQGGWTGPGSNNINQNPLFSGGTNYRLQMGSPCIDTGSDAYAPADDLDGQSRPLDGNNDGTARADMGAYEAIYTDVDLIVQSITTSPRYPRAGEPISVTVSIRNEGATAASSFWLDWYAHRASPPAPGNYGDHYQKFDTLAGGTTATMTRIYTYPTPGTYLMYAQVDTEQQVDETNETNNVFGPQAVNVVAGDLLAFDTKEDVQNAVRWFGGDDQPGCTRNLGAGQSFIPARDAKVQSVAFHFDRRFDYYQNPEGVGHAVWLMLNIRNSTGAILRTVSKSVPASFNGGWITFTYLGATDLWLNAGERYIFTCYLHDGENLKYWSGITANNHNPWPMCSGYLCTVSGSPADMQAWANWTADSLWDFNFHITGHYVEPYPGDLNSDWRVGIDDAVILAGDWLRDDCLMLDWCDGCDINWSKKVELADFAVLSAYWNKSYTPPAYSELNRGIIAKVYQHGHLSSADIDGSNGSEFKPGTYFVYRTSAGRLGKFIVENWEPASGNRLTIAWVTYNTNGTVYSSGTGLVIRGTYSCDLDTGAETTTGADFWWNMQSTTTRYLTPRNGALFKLIYRAP